ncbi:hypothetical protein ACJX0J_007133 [Zea mays]
MIFDSLIEEIIGSSSPTTNIRERLRSEGGKHMRVFSVTRHAKLLIPECGILAPHLCGLYYLLCITQPLIKKNNYRTFDDDLIVFAIFGNLGQKIVFPERFRRVFTGNAS